MTNRRDGSRRRGRRREAGQTLVEFALVFPLFLLLLLAVIEFTFVFSGMLGISYATRDGALIAAEAGNADGADCLILRTVDDAVGAPADDNRIESIVIYRADRNGVEMPGVSNTWVRGGSTACATGSPVPYTRTTNGYPEESRCNIVAGDVGGGCEAGHDGLDTIGVRITYIHRWVTPLGGFPGPGFGGQGGSGFTLSQSNSMRMEPIL
ncbi:MAG: pilus assembly protein [Chloroflexi bacterium]|nr:pilus assembly protein [Chloroflexota bacterium]